MTRPKVTLQPASLSLNCVKQCVQRRKGRKELPKTQRVNQAATSHNRMWSGYSKRRHDWPS